MGPPGRQARPEVKIGDGPPHLLLKMDKIRQDPERGVGGLRIQPFPRVSHETRWLPGPVAMQAVGLPPRASSVLKRIRTPTWALGARRLGLQEEGRGLGLGRWGVSAHYLHLS